MSPSAQPGRPRSYRTVRPVVTRPLPPPHGREGVALRVVASLLVVLVVAGAVLVAYEVTASGHIYQGVRLGGVDVSGLSTAEALDRLSAARDVAGASQFTLRAGSQSWAASAAQLGYTLDVPGSVASAYRLGRTGTPLQRLREQLHLLVDGQSLPFSGAEDAPVLESYLRALAARIDQPGRPAELEMTPAGPRLLAAQDGSRLDVPAAMRLLGTALARGGPNSLALPIVSTHLAATTLAAQRTSARLTHLLAARITITSLGHAWPLSRAALIRMLRPVVSGHDAATTYSVQIDRTAVTGYVWPRVVAAGQAGFDARVLYGKGRVTVVPGRDGRVVDAGAAVAMLADALLRGQDTVLALPVVNGPTVSNEEAEAVAAHLRRVLRTTVVWLPQRHWAIAPAAIAAALTLRRVPAIGGAQLVPYLDAAAIAAYLPGSAALASSPAGHRPNYEALAAEMLAAPPGRAVYHLPIAAYSAATGSR